MDVTTDGQINNGAKDYDIGTNHVHNHGSVHGYNAVREQDEIPHDMIGKEHRTAHMEHMQMQMQTTFSLKTYSDFLLEGVKISSIQGIVLAMLFTFAITMLVDSLKFTTHVLAMRKGSQDKPQDLKKQNRHLFVAAISHTLSVSLAYVMMLCIMTMNVWLMVSVVLGSGIAHFLIRPVLSWKLKEHSEHSEDLNIERNAEEAEPLNHYHDFLEKRKGRENGRMCSLLENNS
ncbi:uncharacterized protein LOC123525126 isoform X2 [Mercenaria mercenaria]|uniref:uncharacterized protein LOC123525126 isoform X2 n=1 Tax=Mercenaria mercenaria TaxID=6596 RepID=UPI001E1DCE42|nr:uncharacterized protein LOC123525126 isoform X2 [Mercenaria mercenaria]